MQVKTEEELAKAINNNENYIELEGDLSRKIIKIKASGNVAWAVVIGSIGVIVIAAISYSKKSQDNKVSFIASGIGATTAVGAVGILGLATTISAIKIAVAGGGNDV
ncbi:TPA: hypothetical protein RZJ77_000450 [Campylobacter coli]|nr:hypothetical protein [Campylobacter coli]EAI7225045.1 hypothetical protein [Campylobacter coli]HEB7717464.1 hypothetical protein [Campylobacter coli]HEB8061232.1 hypothetical protein [Campylobacter coli]